MFAQRPNSAATLRLTSRCSADLPQIRRSQPPRGPADAEKPQARPPGYGDQRGAGEAFAGKHAEALVWIQRQQPGHHRQRPRVGEQGRRDQQHQLDQVHGQQRVAGSAGGGREGQCHSPTADRHRRRQPNHHQKPLRRTAAECRRPDQQRQAGQQNNAHLAKPAEKMSQHYLAGRDAGGQQQFERAAGFFTGQGSGQHGRAEHEGHRHGDPLGGDQPTGEYGVRRDVRLEQPRHPPDPTHDQDGHHAGQRGQGADHEQPSATDQPPALRSRKWAKKQLEHGDHISSPSGGGWLKTALALRLFSSHRQMTG